MKQLILHIICEGQTEERFVKKVLAPYLSAFQIVAKALLVTTSNSKHGKGGVVNFAHIERDIHRALKLYPDKGYERHIITTFIDYYGLPNEFPAFSESQQLPSPYQQVEHLEKAFAQAISSSRFIPYIQLHEFETLIFCGCQHLSFFYGDCRGLEERLLEELHTAENPELINGGRRTSPSKRLIQIIENEYKQKYDKPLMAEYVTSRVGIERLRECCPHFNQWVESLLTCAQPQE